MEPFSLVSDLRYGMMKVMRHRWRIYLIGLLLQTLFGCMNETRAATNTNSLLPIEILSVSTTNILTTMMGYFPTTPPPWTDGNNLSFTFRRQTNDTEELVVWRVINMRTENFGEITRRLKMDSVKVAVVHNPQWTIETRAGGPRLIRSDEGSAVVIDSRIPNEWFSQPRGPRTNPAALRLEQAFPDKFGK